MLAKRLAVDYASKGDFHARTIVEHLREKYYFSKAGE
jgi:hypothetical protein